MSKPERLIGTIVHANAKCAILRAEDGSLKRLRINDPLFPDGGGEGSLAGLLADNVGRTVEVLHDGNEIIGPLSFRRRRDEQDIR